MGDPRRGAAMGRPALPCSATDHAALRARIAKFRGFLAHYETLTPRDREGLAHQIRADRAAIERMESELAALGPEPAPKVRMQRVRLDSGGYDSGGAYWGRGAPLYWAGSDCGLVEMWFRAADRDAAKAVVCAGFPLATFHR
jgi:hypothetical protein